MSTTSASATKQAKNLPSILALVTIILGIVMIVAGIAVYIGTCAQLKAQNITVAPRTATDHQRDAGKQVAGPFTALAQIQVVGFHVSEATAAVNNGVPLKFGQMKQIATSNGVTYNADVTAATSTDGQTHNAGDPLSAADAKYYNARWTAQQGAWTQASLIVSELAFGIAVLVMGIGIVVIIVGLALKTSQPKAELEAAKE